MLAVPPAILDILRLKVGATVGLSVDGERLVVQPNPEATPKYTLDELLAQCDASAPGAEEDGVWLNIAPVGKEI